jgi:hypothetical protein
VLAQIETSLEKLKLASGIDERRELLVKVRRLLSQADKIATETAR